MQARPQMTEGQPRTRHAAHALIAVTYVGGPEQLYRIAVCYTDGREVDNSLTYRATTYDKAAEIGNQLWGWFNTHTITEALDEPPVLRAIQPAADLIAAATALLVLAADVAKLSRPQRDAIAAAKGGHIVRGNGVSVSTLYALEGAHLGVCVREDPRRAHRVTGFDLSVRGLQMQAHILTHQHPIAA